MYFLYCSVPTHTRYDFSEILNARSSGIRTRKAATAEEMVSIEFIHFLDRGRWYLSIYNDGDQQEEVSFVSRVAGELLLVVVAACDDTHTHTCVCVSFKSSWVQLDSNEYLILSSFFPPQMFPHFHVRMNAMAMERVTWANVIVIQTSPENHALTVSNISNFLDI